MPKCHFKVLLRMHTQRQKCMYFLAILFYFCENLSLLSLFRCGCCFFFFLFLPLFVPLEVCRSKNCLVVISQHFLKYVSWVSVRNSGNSMLLILLLFAYIWYGKQFSFHNKFWFCVGAIFFFVSCFISRAQRIFYHTILSVVYPGHFVVRFLDFLTHFVSYFKFTGRYFASMMDASY